MVSGRSNCSASRMGLPMSSVSSSASSSPGLDQRGQAQQRGLRSGGASADARRPRRRRGGGHGAVDIGLAAGGHVGQLAAVDRAAGLECRAVGRIGVGAVDVGAAWRAARRLAIASNPACAVSCRSALAAAGARHHGVQQHVAAGFQVLRLRVLDFVVADAVLQGTKIMVGATEAMYTASCPAPVTMSMAGRPRLAAPWRTLLTMSGSKAWAGKYCTFSSTSTWWAAATSAGLAQRHPCG